MKNLKSITLFFFFAFVLNYNLNGQVNEFSSNPNFFSDILTEARELSNSLQKDEFETTREFERRRDHEFSQFSARYSNQTLSGIPLELGSFNADKELFQVQIITASGIYIERPIGLVEQVDVRVANNGRFLFKIEMSTDDARSLKQDPGVVTANLKYDLNLKEGTLYLNVLRIDIIKNDVIKYSVEPDASIEDYLGDIDVDYYATSGDLFRPSDYPIWAPLSYRISTCCGTRIRVKFEIKGLSEAVMRYQTQNLQPFVEIGYRDRNELIKPWNRSGSTYISELILANLSSNQTVEFGIKDASGKVLQKHRVSLGGRGRIEYSSYSGQKAK